MLDIFSQITLIILTATLLGIVARWFSQPTILAYLIAGITVGLFGYFEFAENIGIYEIFSDLGIMFLLFLVGLEINYTSLRVIGRDATLIGFGQVIFTFLLGFLIAVALGFSTIAALYIGLALTFSSTIIVVNLLSEKKDLNSVYGKISLGILLVQDFVVVMALILIAGTSSDKLSSTFLGKFFDTVPELINILSAIGTTFIKGAIILFVAFYLSKKIIPSLFSTIAKSKELIFLTSLAWLFMLTWVIDFAGFSKEIGGFLAGVTLANSFEHFQIANRIRSLRDFFVLVFFVILGSSLVIATDFTGLLVPIIVLSLFILIGNPLIVFLVMIFRGYSKRPAFLTGITIAQVSEFSLILIALGVTVGHIPQRVGTLITSVGVITIVISTYLFTHSTRLFGLFSPYLSLIERKNVKRDGDAETAYTKPVVLAGFHRTGQSIAYNITKDDVLVIDYDPEMIEILDKDNFAHIFGDISDSEVIDRINLPQVRVMISTSPDLDSNVLFLSDILARRKKLNATFRVVVRARTDREARILYTHGADYVLLPHMTAGRFIAKVMAQDPYLQLLLDARKKDLLLLERYNKLV